MNTTAEKALNFITNAITSGRTVYVSTMTRVVAISPATFARWEKSGNKLFKFSDEGELMMAAGNSFNRITGKGIMLVGLSAR
jgi:hypothetical protein